MRQLNTRGDMSKFFTNSPILRNNHELHSLAVNKSQIHRELRYFLGISLNLIKSNNKLKCEIRDFDIFGNIT